MKSEKIIALARAAISLETDFQPKPKRAVVSVLEYAAVPLAPSQPPNDDVLAVLEDGRAILWTPGDSSSIHVTEYLLQAVGYGVVSP